MAKMTKYIQQCANNKDESFLDLMINLHKNLSETRHRKIIETAKAVHSLQS